jgi:hypothetical protein
MTTNKNNGAYLLTQELLNSNTTTDVHTPLQSFPMNSSKKTSDIFHDKMTYF